MILRYDLASLDIPFASKTRFEGFDAKGEVLHFVM